MYELYLQFSFFNHFLTAHCKYMCKHLCIRQVTIVCIFPYLHISNYTFGACDCGVTRTVLPGSMIDHSDSLLKIIMWGVWPSFGGLRTCVFLAPLLPQL